MSDLLTDEKIAEQYSLRRPGYHLVSCRRVLRPLTRLIVRVLTVEKRSLPPIQEFILKTLSAGLYTAQEIAGFLGLERRVADTSISTLIGRGDLFIHAPMGTKHHRLMLTDKGQRTLQELFSEVTEECQVPVLIDGLTRHVELDIADKHLIKPQVARHLFLPELASYPPNFQHSLTELQAALPLVFDKLPKNIRGKRRMLLAVKEVERVQPCCGHDTLLLIYRSPTDGSIDVDIIVGGRVSEAHQQSFRRSEQERSLKLLPNRLEGVEEQYLKLIGSDLFRQIPSFDETSRLRVQIDVALTTWLQLQGEQNGLLSNATTPSMQLEQAHKTWEDLRLAQEAHPIRWLEVFEQPRLLREALETAKERVVILSPWIRQEIMDASLIQALTTALDRKVNILIGYGYRANRENQSDAAVINELEQLARRKKGLTLQKVSQPFSNLLACDDRFVVMTEYNWLSWYGSPYRLAIDERGILLRNRDLILRYLGDALILFSERA